MSNASSPLKVAVVGYGGSFNMGRQHLREMQESGMVPTAVCDIDPERRKAARKEWPGIATYGRLASLLEKSEVDLVTVITPHNTHARLALQCLQAGRSVVIEKPMTLTTAECDRLIAEASARSLLLSTYHNRHWDGHILKAVEAIRGGAIGEIVRIEAHIGGRGKPGEWWRSQRSISGGILYDWGVHLLEYALQLLEPSALTEVSGYAKSGFWAPQTPYGDDTNEDEAHLVARFADGRWLSLNVSSLDSHPKDDRGVLEITGTKGTYLLRFDKWTIRCSDGEGGLTVEEGRNPAGEGWRFYRNIAAALRGEEALIITPEWARRPVHILDLAVRSAKAGRALPAKYA